MFFLMAVISVWSTACSGNCATIKAARGAVRRSEAWKAWECLRVFVGECVNLVRECVYVRESMRAACV